MNGLTTYTSQPIREGLPGTKKSKKVKVKKGKKKKC